MRNASRVSPFISVCLNASLTAMALVENKQSAKASIKPSRVTLKLFCSI